MTHKPAPTRRDQYPLLVRLSTRWGDNDAYGHINNVVYYALFDTAVNRHLIERGVLDIGTSPEIGVVVESQCRYFSSMVFPDEVVAGVRVMHLGSSSVQYEIALFRNDESTASAVGRFVHVYVERASNRPTLIPPAVRSVLSSLVLVPA